MDEVEIRDRFFNRRTDKTIIGSRFVNSVSGQRYRIASHVLEGTEGLQFARILDEVVLRTTRAARFQIKATFLEDDRGIEVLTIQRYSQSRPLEQSFSFVGTEINALLEFVACIRAAELEHEGKVHISDEAAKSIVLNYAQARRLFANNEVLFAEIAQNEELQRDLVSLGYRRKQLARFERLLTDAHYFAQEQDAANVTVEGLWQDFFEKNTWIFGYGLSFQFLASLDHKKLEQVVRGADVTGWGKRSDALMKTRGLISSLCFIEIKRHDTALLESTRYRSGVWGPSHQLTSSVAQVQGTVQDAVEQIGRKLVPNDDAGDPTGETLFNVEPRSCLIVGNLSEFHSAQGINEGKFRSFELYRRNTHRPEILTFDELLERARFIVREPITENGGERE